VIVLGALILGTGAFLTPIFSSYTIITFAIFLVGLGWSAINVATTALITDLTPPDERGRMLGANDVTIGLAALSLPVLGGFVIANFGLSTLGFLGSMAESHATASQLPYRQADVIDFLLDQLAKGHPILVADSGHLHLLTKGVPSFATFCPAKYQETIEGSKFSQDLRGETEEGSFSVTPPIYFYWGRQSWIAYSELRVRPKVLRLLNYDLLKATEALKLIRDQSFVGEPPRENARRFIHERIDTIKHLGEYPPGYQERIWFAELVAKNYSLGTRLGFLGAVVGFMVAVVALILVSEQASRFVELQSLMWLLSFVGIGAGWFVGKEIGSYLENDAAKKGVIYRRNIHRLVPIPVPRLGWS
jgi:hypothetical protein